MSWDWEGIYARIPEDKREYIENLHNAAELIPTLPKSLKKAIVVDKAQFDALFLKAYEIAWRSYTEFILEDFEAILLEFKSKTENLNDSYLIYFPESKLYIYELDRERTACIFRMIKFTNKKEEGFFGG